MSWNTAKQNFDPFLVRSRNQKTLHEKDCFYLTSQPLSNGKYETCWVVAVEKDVLINMILVHIDPGMANIWTWHSESKSKLDLGHMFGLFSCEQANLSVRQFILCFFSCGIQAKKISNFHQCPCPMFATGPVVYTTVWEELR